MPEIYKYFSWLNGDQWMVNELITMQQCMSMLQTLDWKFPVFASIQDYNADGDIAACPLYFDIDAPELEDAAQDAWAVVQACEYLIKCTPRIYFSGSKGFHLIIERKIEHPRCHEIARHFAQEAASHVHHVDRSVYTSRRMFRIPTSPASKPGFYKIELTRMELFKLCPTEIRQLARTRRTIVTEHDPSKIDEDVWAAWYAQALRELPTVKTVEALQKNYTSVSTEITPCIVTMLTKPAMPGERHNTIFTLARFFRSCEVDEGTAISLILEQPHHLDYEKERGEVSKTVKSVYRGRVQSSIGCRGNGVYPELMRSFCAAPCHFRSDFNRSPFVKEPVKIDQVDQWMEDVVAAEAAAKVPTMPEVFE